VSTAKNLATLKPCLMGADVGFFPFPISKEISSLSSSYAEEESFSFSAYVRFFLPFGAGAALAGV